MWPYWIMFLVPSWMALNTTPGGGPIPKQFRMARATFPSTIIWLSLTLLVGFRFEVGGDWYNYLRFLNEGRLDFVDTLFKPDPAYHALNWLSVNMGFGIIGVNVIGSGIFALGLTLFCRAQPQPWLALAVAIPYLVIVVGMGYSRQAIALGIEMIGLLALTNLSTKKFVFSTFAAGAFHKSALLLLPIGALSSSSNRYWTATWVGASALACYYLLLEKESDAYVRNYIGGQMQSSGAALRLMMNAVPSVIFLFRRSKFSFSRAEASLWGWLSLISILLLILLIVMPTASTALDRMALYMLPLQIIVFSRLPMLLGSRGSYEQQMISSSASTATATIAVLSYYGLVLFVWLNYADNAYAWREYKFYLLE